MEVRVEYENNDDRTRKPTQKCLSKYSKFELCVCQQLDEAVTLTPSHNSIYKLMSCVVHTIRPYFFMCLSLSLVLTPSRKTNDNNDDMCSSTEYNNIMQILMLYDSSF